MLIAVVIIAFIGFLFWVFPIYNVWASKRSGEADLEQAHYEQQIQVAKANSRLQAAETNKKAAIIEVEHWDEGCGDYAECENCRIVWYEEKGRVKIEEW